MIRTINNITSFIAKHTGKEYHLFTSRAATAIYMILMAITKSETRVVVPSNICLSVIAAIIFSGNNPYLLDIDINSQSIDPALLRKENPSIPSVVIYPHMYGICHHNINVVQKLCAERGWFLIEDCAQALGGKVGSNKVGAFGDVSVFSFGSGKIIDCGCGGIIASDDTGMINELAYIYSMISEYPYNKEREAVYGNIFKCLYKIGEEKHFFDISPIYRSLLKTFNDIFVYRNNDLPFEEIFCSLVTLESNLAIRENNAALLKKEFDNAGIKFLKHPDGSIYWRFNVLFPKQGRNAILGKLHENGLHASSWFPTVIRFFEKPGIDQFPNSDLIEKEILNLWVNDKIDGAYIRKVTNLTIIYFNEVMEHMNV